MILHKSSENINFSEKNTKYIRIQGTYYLGTKKKDENLSSNYNSSTT